MNRKLLSLLVSPTGALLLIAVSSNAYADFTIEETVDCAVADVQQVLDDNIYSLPMELKLIGACAGFEITQDDVSIAPLDDSVCPGATVAGEISMEGAHRIKLSCMEVAGPGGVVMLGSYAVLEDMLIAGGEGVIVDVGQIEVYRGSIVYNEEGIALQSGYAVIEDVDISNNAGDAIRAENNSYVEFGGGTVMDNGEYGVSIRSSSVLSMEETIVSNNGLSGVFVGGSSRADIIDAVATGNRRSGMAITDNSSVRWNGGRIAGNNWNGIFVTAHSTLRVLPGELQEGQATEIVDNGRAGIYLTRDAGAQLYGAYIPPNGNGSAIKCEGREASVDFDRSPLIVKKFVDCNDPSF